MATVALYTNDNCGETPIVASDMMYSYTYAILVSPSSSNRLQQPEGSVITDPMLVGKKVITVEDGNQAYTPAKFTKSVNSGTLTMTNGTSWYAGEGGETTNVTLYWKYA